MKNKIFTLLFVIAASIGTISAEIHSGTCGDHLAWELNTDVGTLTIEGYGEMTSVPWNLYITQIRQINFPEGLTNIADNAFNDCTGLVSITIPNSVTNIGNYAFSDCSSLTSVTIPNSVTNIGNYAFSDCTNLTSATIGNSVRSIGEFAFWECRIRSVEIPYSVTSIGDGAFHSCLDLKTLILNSDYIASNTSYAKSLKSYIDTQIKECIVGDSVTRIGDYAFRNFESLTTLTISNSVKSIGEYDVFESIEDIHYTSTIEDWITKEWDPSNVSTNYNLYIGNDKITALVIPSNITNITKSAFYGCSSITSVAIPSNISCIGESAFCECHSLTSVTIANGVTSIGEDAFNSCEKLTSVSIPNSITSIGNYAFKWCTNLISVTLNSNTIVNNREKSDIFGSQVKEYIIGEDVKNIGDYAFEDYSSLTSITIGNGVTSIGECAFKGCSRLSSVTIPNSVISIGEEAFYGCRAMTSVIIPNSVTNIATGAFYGCSSLTSVTIPNSITSIKSLTFRSCSGLISIEIPNSVTSIGDMAFYGCSQLVSVDIPNGVTSIGGNAFYNCAGLTSVNIPNGVTNIENNVFYNCTGLTSVTIPNSVTYIGNNAFYGCNNLSTIYNYATKPQAISKNAFNKVNTETCILFVPSESVDAYREKKVWKDFKNILPIEDDNLFTVKFIDWNGTVLKVDEVEPNSAAVAPTDPTREGYTFTGWDKDFSNVTEDLVVTAQYQINHYEVKFVDWDGSTLKSENVDYGNSATAPADPTRDGYIFIGWDKDFSSVTANMIVTALYEPESEPFVPTLDINIDGDFSDWSMIPQSAVATAATDARSAYESLYLMKWAMDVNNIFFYIEYSADADDISKINILLNSDNNPTTGYNTGLWQNAAADFMYEKAPDKYSSAVPYNFNSDDQTAWAWASTGISGTIVACSPVDLTNGHRAIEGKIIKGNFPAEVASTIHVGVYSTNATWKNTGCLPQYTTAGASSMLEVNLYTNTPTNLIQTGEGNTHVDCTKLIRNGQIFILRGDKTYTVQGQEVR